MKNHSFFVLFALITCILTVSYAQDMKQQKEFKVLTEQFADLGVLRYQVPGFENLTPKQKELAYYLYEAALWGREIFQDQNYKYNLLVRRTLEAIVNGYTGDKKSDDYAKFMVYTKRVWFSNGIHHHYSAAKFIPDFSKEYFAGLIKSTPAKLLPLNKGQKPEELYAILTPIMFDPNVAALKINQAADVDVISKSATNFYEGLTQKEVENFYNSKMDPNDKEPISVGLNSKLVKENGKIVEKVWKTDGMYAPAMKKMVGWLNKAVKVAENPQQKKTLQLLIDYYKTGDLKKYDQYCIEWVKDENSVIDISTGFIETYGDPLGYKGSYESVLSLKDFVASKRIDAIGKQAQWFEDNSPIPQEYKKKDVKGITAKVITVIVESGDASPSTPIGINLPNATWIRKEHGSKSVNLGNIVHSYNIATSGGVLKEFAFDEAEYERGVKFANLGDDLHTDMHEVIGHASGQIKPGVGTPRETLKNYSSTIEETRADLVALYYVLDPKLVEIGVMPSLETGKAEYDRQIRNGLMTQLQRIKLGDNIEQAHMRNRQLIASWAFEKGKAENVIEKVKKDGKTYFVIRDYNKLRKIFGAMLNEIQRITSEGDFKAAQELVEKYAVKVDQELHKEVLQRFAKLNIPAYRGFINPVLEPVMKDGKIVDVKVTYPDDFTKQMLYYAKYYSILPTVN